MFSLGGGAGCCQLLGGAMLALPQELATHTGPLPQHALRCRVTAKASPATELPAHHCTKLAGTPGEGPAPLERGGRAGYQPQEATYNKGRSSRRNSKTLQRGEAAAGLNRGSSAGAFSLKAEPS